MTTRPLHPAAERPMILPSAFNRQRIVQYFFFATFLFLLWQGLRILAPFYAALMGSALLALLAYPTHARLLRVLGRWPNAAAGVSTAGVVLVVIVPFLGTGWMCVRESARVYPVVREWVRETPFFQTGPRAARLPLPERIKRTADSLLPFTRKWEIKPQEVLLSNLDNLSEQITRLAAGIIKNAVFFVFQLLVLVFTLFFFLRDGPLLMRKLVELVPMTATHKQAVLGRLHATLFAVVRGIFLVAAIQGVVAAAGFALFGVPFPALLAVLIALLGLIPFIGPAAVWVPVVIGLFISEAYSDALGMFCWGLFISGIDNFLRPLLISADAKLPLLLIFFGMLGGLKVYGPSGLLLGPAMIALLLAFINIYRREYDWLLNPAPK